MRTWKKILLAAVALLLVLVAGAVVFVSQMDPNEYRGVLADIIEDATGREMRIGGDLRIELWPLPSAEANDVTLANAPWASQPDMVRVKHVSAKVALLPLLRGRLIVHELVAIEPEVFLETDAQGRRNWVFTAGDEAPARASAAQSSSKRLKVVVASLRIDKARLDFLDATTARKTVVDLDQLTLGAERPEERIAVNLRATYQDLPVRLSGRLGETGAIIANQPIEVDLEGEVGDARLTVQGAVGKPLEGKDVRLDVALKSASTKRISDAVGLELEELGPVDVVLRVLEEGGRLSLDPLTVTARPRNTDARIGGSIKNFVYQPASGAVGPMSVTLEGKLGEAGFEVSGEVDRPLEAKGARLDVVFDAPSTKLLTDLAGVELEELGPMNLTARVLEEGGRLSVDPLRMSARPRGADARISGSIKNFPYRSAQSGGARAIGPMNINLDGALGEAAFKVSGDVDGPADAKGARMDVAFDTPSTKSLTDLAGVELDEFGPVKLTFALQEKDGRLDFDDIRMTARPLDTDASVSGSIGNFALDSDDAEAAAKPVKVDVHGTLGEASFAVSGDAGKPLEAKDLRLQIALESKSTRVLARFAKLAGVEIELEDFGPIKARFEVTEKDGRLDVDGIDATASPKNASVVVKGSVRDALSSPRPDLQVSLKAKSLRQLDRTLADTGPVIVSARVQPKGKVIEIRDLVAKIGKSNLAGSATVDTAGDRPKASARLRGSLIDLAELRPATKKSDGGDAAKKSSQGRIFPDSPLPFDALAKANGDIELAVDRLITPKVTLSKVNVAARLDNGNLTVKPAAHVAGGKIGGTIGIDTRVKPAKVTADVNAEKVSIGTLAKEMRGFETGRGLASDMKLKLSGQGDSVRALMAGLDGDVRIEIGEGRLNNKVLDQVGADLLTQIVGVAVPTDEKDETTILNCGVMRFAIEDGDAIANETLVMETDKVLLKGGGVIDLKTEKLDLGAHLAARKGIRIGAGTLSSLVRVQGTLAEPRLGTDIEGLAKTGARIGIAVATAGLSLLAESAYGYVSEDEHPCQTALARPIEAKPGLIEGMIGSGKTKSTSKAPQGQSKEK